MKDTLVIVAGDCGFGFERKGYYENIVKHNAKRVNESNNWFLFIRGNHDNPAYFDGKTFRYKRFTCIPDYSVVKANGHTILCVGGAISVDRQPRIDAWEHNQRKAHRYSHNSSDNELLSPNYYWQDEAPVFNNDLLSEITNLHKIDTVVTHTAPSFCELQNKDGLLQWAIYDNSLLDDVQKERETMDDYPLTKSSFITLLCTSILLLDRSVVVLYGYINSATNAICCRIYIFNPMYCSLKSSVLQQFLLSKRKRVQIPEAEKGLL